MDGERGALCQLIRQWNESRLDMFAISQPDENLEFQGIIRFFCLDLGGKSTSKCIRCQSTWTASQIVEELLSKFHMNNPSTNFALWELHESGQERQLGPEEQPLWIQLNWNKDDREGRFILRMVAGNDKRQKLNGIASSESLQSIEQFKRGMPKRFSQNERKKRQKPGAAEITKVQERLVEDDELYPYTTFTRTISNPELVMKRRREQKLESRLRQIGNGGTLKIYGIELFPNRPYVSLLVEVTDTARRVVQMALEKYGLEEHSPSNYVLVKMTLIEANSTVRSYSDLQGVEKKQERVLYEDECPLELLDLDGHSNVVFFLRRRPSFPPATISKSITLGDFCKHNSTAPTAENLSRKRHLSAGSLMHASATANEAGIIASSIPSTSRSALLPCLVPINAFASTANFGAAALAIQPGITEIGSSSSCAIQLRAPSVLPRHCCLLYRHEPNGPRVQLSLLDKSALVELNGASIHSTLELSDGVQLRIGGVYCYRFFSCVQQQSGPSPAAALGQAYQSTSGGNHHSSLVALGNTNSSSSVSSAASRPINPFSASTHPSELESLEDGYVDFELPTSTASTATPTYSGLIGKNTGEEMIVLNANSNVPGMGTMPPVQLHHGNGMLHAQHPQQKPQQIMPSLMKEYHRSLPILLECLDQNCENDLFQSELFGHREQRQYHHQQQQFPGGSQRFGAFRLIPAFVLYTICRHRLQHCQWDVQQQLNRNTLTRFIDHCNRTIKANLSVREVLVFWLANASELLNMARSDAELAQSVGVQLLSELAQLVQHIFNLFVESCRQSAFCGIQNALNLASLAQANKPIQAGPLLSALDECLRCVRWALLNPALTIQMFSQLFHFISSSIFNWLVISPEAHSFINFSFGIRLRQLLQQIQGWAQKQGLELAAECHMDLIAQTVNLLTTPKTIEQIATLGATCYKLNSIQIRYLLENYMGDMRSGESPTVGREVVENVVALARQQADQMAPQHKDGPKLAEPNCLHLPFLIPQDGYVVEKLQGIPPDMAAFLNALQQRGICRVHLQQNGPTPIAKMSWTVFLSASFPKPRPHQSRVLSSTPALGDATNIVAAMGNRSTTPVTMFPPIPVPNVPLHQQNRSSGSPAVYAEVQRRPNETMEHQQQQPRCVSTSILPSVQPGHPHPNCPTSSMPPPLKQQWNERMIDALGQKEVLVQKIVIKRGPNEGLGLSIVEVGTPGHGSGIYVKAVIAGSPAEKDGRISAGDQLLSVNGQTLLGVQQEMAAQKIVSSGPVVHLELAKKAAQLNGIAPYLQNGFPQPQPNWPQQQQQQQLNDDGFPIGRLSLQQPLVQQKPTTNGSGKGGGPAMNGAQQQQRPTSASELHYQAVEMGNAHGNGAVRSPVIYGTPEVLHCLQHSQQSSTSSVASRLPAHYKPASNRPQVVLQPGRPASSSPLNSRRSQASSSQSNRSTPTQLAQNGGTLFIAAPTPMTFAEQPGRGHFTTDYSQMPPIGQPSHPADSPPINSSTTNSTSSGGMGEWLEKKEAERPMNGLNVPQMPLSAGQPPNSPPPPSGRLSAPLFGAEQPQAESLQDVERELDELDSSDGQMSDTDQKRYRELLERLARMKRQKSMGSKAQSNVRLPPSMMAAAQQLERQSKSLAALSLDPGRSLASKTAKSATNLMPTSEKHSKDPKRSEAARELVQEITEVVKRKQPPAVPAKPAIREFQRPPSATLALTTPFDSSLRKRVQFSIHQSNNNKSNEENSIPAGMDEEDGEGEGQVIDEEPRVQIVGAQEVYVNDPRQRRLQEMQANKMLKPVVDSSALGFREKMRMFAEQLGEKEPQPNCKSPHKSSSAERQILQQKEEQA